MSGLAPLRVLPHVLELGALLVEFLDQCFEALGDGGDDGLVALVGRPLSPVGVVAPAGDVAEGLVVAHDLMVTVSSRSAKPALTRAGS